MTTKKWEKRWVLSRCFRSKISKNHFSFNWSFSCQLSLSSIHDKLYINSCFPLILVVIPHNLFMMMMNTKMSSCQVSFNNLKMLKTTSMSLIYWNSSSICAYPLIQKLKWLNLCFLCCNNVVGSGKSISGWHGLILFL